MEALMMKKKYKAYVVNFLIAQENYIQQLGDYYGQKMYKELQEKFKPWVCLRELDNVATVSFHGYEVIRRIEFHEKENDKYLRGLFKNR